MLTMTGLACREARGEYKGWQRHQRAREDPCDECRQAHRDYHAADNRARRADGRIDAAAQQRAMRALASWVRKNHPEIAREIEDRVGFKRRR